MGHWVAGVVGDDVVAVADAVVAAGAVAAGVVADEELVGYHHFEALNLASQQKQQQQILGQLQGLVQGQVQEQEQGQEQELGLQ